MNQVGVYLDGFPFHLRRRHSDWSYVEEKMPRVADWAPDIRFVQQTSPRVLLRANFKAVRATLGRRMGFPLSQWSGPRDRFQQADAMMWQCFCRFAARSQTYTIEV
jgi:hypothetical protein